jgi:UDP-N-acetylmuramyl pentapeptide phosphotransferase/UDP-N-acetylglucosamine-1-phosphate transferase
MSTAVLIGTAVASTLISGALVLALMPVLRRYALSRPNTRSSHRTPTPQGGGIAVIAATVITAAATCVISGVPPTWIIFATSIVIAAVGAIDDIRTVQIAPRLLLQTAAVAIVIASVPSELQVIPIWPWWIERILLLIAGLWFVNLTNFMDGLDWMTVAEFVPITAGLALFGLSGALPTEGIIVAVALGGALIGFAPFNRPVARLFLGDVGSLPIGLLVGWLLLLLAGNGHLAAAMILPLYYLADATITLFRRILSREPFWQAHRSHFYQQATDRGFSVREIVGRVFVVNLALVALAGTTLVWPGRLISIFAFAAASALVAWLLVSFARGRA